MDVRKLGCDENQVAVATVRIDSKTKDTNQMLDVRQCLNVCQLGATEEDILIIIVAGDVKC